MSGAVELRSILLLLLTQLSAFAQDHVSGCCVAAVAFRDTGKTLTEPTVVIPWLGITLTSCKVKSLAKVGADLIRI